MEWQNIKDGLPEKDDMYLICAKTADPKIPHIQLCWYDSKFGWSLLLEGFMKSITHWMAIERPK